MRTTERRNHVKLLLLGAVLALAAVSGCDTVDDIAPAVPTGVFTVTGDEMVTVYWNDIDEADLVAYDIYRNDPSIADPYEYHYVGTVRWNENYDSGSLLHWFDDYDVVNGETYYYAVLSVDESGNESALSYEDVFDTPRPEGYDVWMYDRFGQLGTMGGFDFSDLQSVARPWNDPAVDMYVEFDGDGIPWIVAADDDVQLQDYGTIQLQWVDWAPRDGYSAAGRAELIAGHSYIVMIADHGIHFAKFQVTALESGRVRIDWAYQVDEDNPELRAPANPERIGALQEFISF